MASMIHDSSMGVLDMGAGRRVDSRRMYKRIGSLQRRGCGGGGRARFGRLVDGFGPGASALAAARQHERRSHVPGDVRRPRRVEAAERRAEVRVAVPGPQLVAGVRGAEFRRRMAVLVLRELRAAERAFFALRGRVGDERLPRQRRLAGREHVGRAAVAPAPAAVAAVAATPVSSSTISKMSR